MYELKHPYMTELLKVTKLFFFFLTFPLKYSVYILSHMPLSIRQKISLTVLFFYWIFFAKNAKKC